MLLLCYHIPSTYGVQSTAYEALMNFEGGLVFCLPAL